MTAAPGFWPGLALAVLALTVWWHFAGLPRFREWSNRQTLMAKGYCPDCALPAAHCHCFNDGGL